VASFGLANKLYNAVCIASVKHVVVSSRDRLVPVLTKYSASGVVKLTIRFEGFTVADTESLANYPSLRSLIMMGCGIDDDVASALAKNEAITKLCLRHNSIGEAGKTAMEAVRARFEALVSIESALNNPAMPHGRWCLGV
jgi:hypothetical protein